MTYQVNVYKFSNGTLQTPVDITQYVLNGFSIVEKLDEGLDVGNIVLRGLTTEIPYYPYDIIQIKMSQ